MEMQEKSKKMPVLTMKVYDQYKKMTKCAGEILELAEIPQQLYSINTYKEGAFCIENHVGTKNNILVYFGQNGNRCFIEQFPDNPLEAIAYFLHRIQQSYYALQ